MSVEAKKSNCTVQVILLLSGIVLMIAGIMQGDYQDTLRKAVTICLECIGIG